MYQSVLGSLCNTLSNLIPLIENLTLDSKLFRYNRQETILNVRSIVYSQGWNLTSAHIFLLHNRHTCRIQPTLQYVKAPAKTWYWYSAESVLHVVLSIGRSSSFFPWRNNHHDASRLPYCGSLTFMVRIHIVKLGACLNTLFPSLCIRRCKWVCSKHRSSNFEFRSHSNCIDHLQWYFTHSGNFVKAMLPTFIFRPHFAYRVWAVYACKVDIVFSVGLITASM